MQINTKAFGEVQYSQDQLVDFPEGILGFPDFQKFVLLQGEQFEDWELLQSLENPDLAFLVLKPELICPDYMPEVHSEDLRKIGLQSVDQSLVLSIITIRDKIEDISANFGGPIIINIQNKKGIQAVSNNDSHPVRFYFMREQGGHPC